MRNKVILITVLFATLLLLAISVRQKGYENLLLIISQANRDIHISVEEIERINEEEFLTTYIVEQEKNVQVIHDNHSISLRGTNYTYPFVLNYNLLNGGFFTETAQDQMSRVVVLNQLAAFEMFGGNDCIGNEITMDGDIYTVVGVVDDKEEENENVYVPITRMKESPNEFMTGLSADISEGSIKAEYKYLGITTDNYHFINLGSFSQMIRERAIVACILFIMLLLIFMMKLRINRFFSQYKALQESLRQNYLMNLFIWETKAIALFIGNGIFIVLLASFICLLGAYVFEILLRWRDLSFSSIRSISVAFMDTLEFIEMTALYSNIFLIAFTVLLILGVIEFGNSFR